MFVYTTLIEKKHADINELSRLIDDYQGWGFHKKNHLEDYLDGNESFEIRLEKERKNYITMEIYPDREGDKIRSRGKFIRIGIKFYDVLNHRQQTTFQ